MISLDQIALPDLAPAAMENWGLITYQEGDLLFEEGVSSLLQKEWITTLIAHELAHQVRAGKQPTSQGTQLDESYNMLQHFVKRVMLCDTSCDFYVSDPFLLTVVWKFGDDEMVEPNLAERGLCNLHGNHCGGEC